MADITTTQIFTDGERGITATKMNNIVGGSTIQPAFYSSKPVSTTLVPGDKLLTLKASGAYAQSDFQNVIDSVSAGINSDAEIWNVRLRSFNAIGNPNFEVDQRNVGTLVGAPGLIQDRWGYQKVGTMVCSVGQRSPGTVLPGTNYQITQNYFAVSLSTAQASLGASDNIQIYQNIEGPNFRELQSDVHSISLLVRSTVSGLKFGLYVRDSPITKSLVKLCTIPTANTWTLIQLPNLPVWPSGNFITLAGNIGYTFGLCLAAGTTLTTSANDTWQSGNFIGAIGQDNFASKPVNSTFNIAFVQHEPGPVCSTFMDKPFSQNLDECLRYYQKSYPYGTAAGAVNSQGIVNFYNYTGGGTNIALTPVRFPKIMAKLPTITGYSNVTGLINNIRDGSGSADRVISAPNTIGDSGFNGFTITGGVAAPINYQFHYTADTGW